MNDRSDIILIGMLCVLSQNKQNEKNK